MWPVLNKSILKTATPFEFWPRWHLCIQNYKYSTVSAVEKYCTKYAYIIVVKQSTMVRSMSFPHLP